MASAERRMTKSRIKPGNAEANIHNPSKAQPTANQVSGEADCAAAVGCVADAESSRLATIWGKNQSASTTPAVTAATKAIVRPLLGYSCHVNCVAKVTRPVATLMRSQTAKRRTATAMV